MDRGRIYERLMNAKIMNNKKKPSAKINIASVSDYNIITYFNGVARGLLSYYRCADDFYKMKSIVNWFLRYSAVSTIKFKHKLVGRKTVFDTYGMDLNMTNHEGKTTHLISTKEVMEMKQEYLINPEIDWMDRIRQVWNTYSKQEVYRTKCSVVGCVTPYQDIEMHHVRHLNRGIDENGYKVIRGKGKKLYGWKAFDSGLKRKQTPLCRKHHLEIHNKELKDKKIKYNIEFR